MIQTNEIKRILVIRPDALGDMVMITPVLYLLRQNFPEAHIAVLCRRYNGTLIEDWKTIVNETIEDPLYGKRWLDPRELWNFAQQIKSKRFDLAIHLYPETAEMLLTWLAGIKYRIGDKDRLAGKIFWHKYGIHSQTANQNKHYAEFYLEHLVPLGINNLTEPLHLPILIHQQKQVRNRFREAGFDETVPVVAIHLGVGGGNVAWKPEYYAEVVVKLILEDAVQVVLIGHGKKESYAADLLLSKLDDRRKLLGKRLLNLVNQMSLKELMGLLSLVDLYIGTDTGPFHIAAAYQRPMVGIFASKRVRPTRWGPWQTKHVIVRPRRVCDRYCPHRPCPDDDCLRGTSVEMVMEGAREMLGEGSGLSGSLSDRDDKREWFRLSSGVMVFQDWAEEVLAKRQVEQLIREGVPVTVVGPRVRTDFTNPMVRYQRLALRPWNLIPMLRIIIRDDLTIIHLFKTKRSWHFKILAQVAALWVFVPLRVLVQKEIAAPIPWEDYL